jgi:hypothetical protein
MLPFVVVAVASIDALAAFHSQARPAMGNSTIAERVEFSTCDRSWQSGEICLTKFPVLKLAFRD